MKASTRGLSALAALVLAASLGACSQTSSSTASGSKTPSASGSSSASTDSLDKQVDDYALSITRCLRDAGFDVPDPAPGKDQQLPEDADPEALKAALDDCMKTLGPGPTVGNEPSAEELTESGLKTAKCLRAKGYDVADPKAGQGAAFEGVPNEAIAQCLAETEK